MIGLDAWRGPLALAAALFLGVPASAEAPPPTAVLEVSILGFPSDEGEAFVALFSDAQSYQDSEAAPRNAARLGVQRGRARWRIEGLEPGEYAIRAYHDANANEQLDKGKRGVPLEPYGFSNDPPRRRGPASWEQARFELAGGLTRIEIHLIEPGRRRKE